MIKPNGYWTKEKCQEEALKYNSRTEFKTNSSTAYSTSCKNKWINELCSHMTPILMKWNIDDIIIEIKNYKSLPDIQKLNPKLYNTIYRLKLSGEVLLILGKTGNRCNKCIYVYEFLDHSAYVGLTYNIEEREKIRINTKRDSVTKHINETGLKPIRKQLTDYIPIEEAIKLEEFYVNKYRDEGWHILNRAKTGAIGGTVVKWTKEACAAEALKYSTKVEFSKNSSSAYTTAKKAKWINEICTHMIELKKPNGYWTKERCIIEALKYKERNEFQLNSNGAYNSAMVNKWLDEITVHMLEFRKPRNYWTFERCLEVALTCTDKLDFNMNFSGAYDAAHKNGWLNEICTHMIKK